MYSDKDNINILTALLIKSGIHHAVVCPGSRNAPIVHNLCTCPDIECTSVTDERSATFIALGMAQAVEEPVVVCVTSGTALLNTLPGVAEAFYQHQPLVIISADRPAAMIDQLQGQTLPQYNALGRFVKKSVTLPEPHDDTERWYCNRLVNEALIETRHHGLGPVHINVPISEPLFNFNVAELPDERKVNLVESEARMDIDIKEILSFRGHGSLCVGDIAQAFAHAACPMLVIGQLPYHEISNEVLNRIRKHAVVLHEQLSVDGCDPCQFDEGVKLADHEMFRPDFLIYMGGTLVSKRLKQYLQSCAPKRTVIVNDTGKLTDVTMHATDIVECSAGKMAEVLADTHWPILTESIYLTHWKGLLWHCRVYFKYMHVDYSPMLAVKMLHDVVNGQKCFMQYGNSTAVRLGQLFSTHFLFVNRGVNGIDGSLSTAVGFASVADQPVYCVLGDLSFFYDQNALWNNLDKTNLRILLLNDGGGGIFRRLQGIESSPYRDKYVSAAHQTTSEGICMETNVEYRTAHDTDSLKEGIDWLTELNHKGPMLLEVFTDADKVV